MRVLERFAVTATSIRVHCTKASYRRGCVKVDEVLLVLLLLLVLLVVLLLVVVVVVVEEGEAIVRRWL